MLHKIICLLYKNMSCCFTISIPTIRTENVSQIHFVLKKKRKKLKYITSSLKNSLVANSKSVYWILCNLGAESKCWTFACVRRKLKAQFQPKCSKHIEKNNLSKRNSGVELEHRLQELPIKKLNNYIHLMGKLQYMALLRILHYAPIQETCIMVYWDAPPSSWPKPMQWSRIKYWIYLGVLYGRIGVRIEGPEEYRNSTGRSTIPTKLDP